MAYASEQNLNTGTGIFASIGQFLSALGTGLSGVFETNQRFRQAEALFALSDAELADRNLRRADIARYVFSDSLWS